jgi:3-oxoacyl-[acyl-carrier-protein] synthase-3
MHRRRLYEALGIDLARDFSTFETLGNMGSVSLPATLAQAVASGAVVAGHRVGLLGIGSGINCMMLALEW